ncbi:MAG: hypothetical protein ACJKTH_00210 [Patescibacteria group bacterium UBA2163]
MDTSGQITYLGSTTLKERSVQFGIKNHDRTRGVCVLGSAAADKTALLINMALQDIDAGHGTLFFTAADGAAQSFLERIDPERTDDIIFLDPASAEYPFSWNVLDDVCTLPTKEADEAVLTLLCELYNIKGNEFMTYVAKLIRTRPDATLITPYTLVTNERAREDFFKDDEKELAFFNSLLEKYPQVSEQFDNDGRYVAQDTLVRNLLGQSESKFTLSETLKGKIVVIDFSHIRIFPTRMKPLMRVFVEVTRLISTQAQKPVALHLHETLRYLTAPVTERLFTASNLMLTTADTLQQEEDKELRESAMSRCGSVVSFSAHPGDQEILERTFYPYISTEEITSLEKGEMVTVLTIDGVRAQPFFATALPLPEKRMFDYQDLLVGARKRYTTSRTAVDASFKTKASDKKGGASGKGRGGFQDAFKSIMADRAKKMPGAAGDKDTPNDAKTNNPSNNTDNNTDKNNTPGARGGSDGSSGPGGKQSEKRDAKKEGSGKKSTEEEIPSTEDIIRGEVPEDVLKDLLYVHPIANTDNASRNSGFTSGGHHPHFNGNFSPA